MSRCTCLLDHSFCLTELLCPLINICLYPHPCSIIFTLFFFALWDHFWIAYVSEVIQCLSFWASFISPGNIPKENKSYVKEITHVNFRIIQNNQWHGISFNIHKENIVYIAKRVLLSLYKQGNDSIYTNLSETDCFMWRIYFKILCMYVHGNISLQSL